MGYWNPLESDDNATPFRWSTFSTEQSIGWMRHAEIKHGRVAMAAFVGFIVQSNGIVFPWDLNLEGVSFADIAGAGGPGAQWDALPTSAKLQILGVIGGLEAFSESTWALAQNGEKHYMKGGTPGYFPSFKTTVRTAGTLALVALHHLFTPIHSCLSSCTQVNEAFPHPVPLDLWDPFGFTKKMSAEKKEKSLVAEINNGRLAMIGIMGFCAASKGLQVTPHPRLDPSRDPARIRPDLACLNLTCPQPDPGARHGLYRGHRQVLGRVHGALLLGRLGPAARRADAVLHAALLERETTR